LSVDVVDVRAKKKRLRKEKGMRKGMEKI